jgi:NAD+ synthase (glutamine-hydrolysing)
MILMISLRIALAQVNPTVGDLEGNARLLAQALERARAAGADLLLAPELALSGYPPEDLLLKPGFVRDCAKAMASLSAACRGLTAVLGFPDYYDHKVFNAAAVLAEGALVAVYYKRELPNYGVFDEKRYFTPGNRGLLLDAEGLRLLVTICEDIWIEAGPAERTARIFGADVVLNLSASPYHAGKHDLRRQVIAGFAGRVQAWVCYCNLVGGQDELVFDGRSLVMDPQGRVAAQAQSFESDLLIAHLEIEAALVPGKLRLSSPEETPQFVSLQLRQDRPQFFQPQLAPTLEPAQEIYSALVLGTRDYAGKNGFHAAVLGLSGGIDSSLVACIAVDALGKDNVIGVTMPSQYTSPQTLADAEALARNLGIRLLRVPITPLFDLYLQHLAVPLQYGQPGVEAENIQARIRGNILMALSNRFGWLPLTTGNKSEMAVGYATLYGDMAGGFAVIKDVFKTVVYELARFVNRAAGRELIPESVLLRAPTAELRPGQKDEDSLPPYEMLDPLLRAYVEDDKTFEEVVAEGFDARLAREVIHLVDRNEYKRRQAPPGVKITPKAFGRDRRLPLTNRYRPRTGEVS